MFSLRQYIEEQATKGLTIFDIDETMFKTKAKVKVIKNGETIKSLTNQEFNKYKLKSGEKFDFGEFKNAKVFNKTSTPIARMIDKVKPQSVPQLVLILADYQYKNAFVADHELNVVACLTEVMSDVQFN